MAAPLSRTWYNGLVDDTGDGVSGTVWNKAQVDGLLDTVDASLVTLVDRAGTPAATQVATFSDADTLTGSAAATVEPSQGALALTGGYPSVVLSDPAATPGDQSVRLVNYANNLYINGVNTLLILSRTGLLTAVGGVHLQNGALTFPTTPIPNAGPTTLDEYREGLWTPTFGGTGGSSGQVYAIQQGTYTKIGREVTCYGWLHMAVAGSFTPGPIFVFGLPFPASAMPGVVTFGAYGALNLTVSSLMGEVIANSQYAALFYIPAVGGVSALALPHTALMAETNCKFRVSYQAAQ